LFSPFHEIGHILNGDIKQKFVNFDSVKGNLEEKADTFASNVLLNFEDYKFQAIDLITYKNATLIICRVYSISEYIHFNISHKLI